MSASSVILLCFVVLVSVHRRPPPRLPPPLLKPPPPPPPRLKPPPPREPKLDEPRLLCSRALEPLNLSEPPNADSLPPFARGTSRCPMRSPPAPAARLLALAPRSRAAAPAWLARSRAAPPAWPARSRAAVPAWLARSRAAPAWPATPDVPTGRALCRAAWRLAIESPRAVPPYLFAVARFW